MVQPASEAFEALVDPVDRSFGRAGRAVGPSGPTASRSRAERIGCPAQESDVVDVRGLEADPALRLPDHGVEDIGVALEPGGGADRGRRPAPPRSRPGVHGRRVPL